MQNPYPKSILDIKTLFFDRFSIFLQILLRQIEIQLLNRKYFSCLPAIKNYRQKFIIWGQFIHISYSWNCLRCGLPDFSTSFFDDFSTSYCSSNSFRVLEASSLSPKTSTPLKKKNTVKRKKKFKIINLNFQSIINKVPEFHCLIETEKPDIVVGTESWLSSDIHNA